MVELGQAEVAEFRSVEEVFNIIMSNPNEPRKQELKMLSRFEESWFWKQLDYYATESNHSYDKTAVNSLRATVGGIVGEAKYIGDKISRFLPQYTLHDEQHFLNVLSIMDALTPNKVMEQLTPLECGLCIMAAYTHDLGMALSDEQYEDLNGRSSKGEASAERQRFLDHRNRFPEELRQIQWYKQKGGKDSEHRIKLIEGRILSDYIRVTHTDDQQSRIGYWLDKIAVIAGNSQLYMYGNVDYKEELVLIGVSHGRNVRWLRDQLTSNGDELGFLRSVEQEQVNIAFPGLLLRLADIMDFDNSRTPTILFHYFGIEDSTSLLEWNKHRSVNGWTLLANAKNQQLKYDATCKNPIYHKTIKEFTAKIEDELKAVRIEIKEQQQKLKKPYRRYTLHLPLDVELNIREEGYEFHDVEFRLQQNEIMQLLMGETLYGDPNLCIRELLQNALDAVQLRDLRLEMEKEGREPQQPVDRLKTFPGRKKEELNVTLTWGQDEESGQEFIRVTDHGVGMTNDVVKRYFTQIGKSFYHSPEFEQERATLAHYNLLVSPISQFGLGILSSFMIADRLQVRTRPGGTSKDEHKAYDITISGPGSLFWFKDGTLDHQGTEVTLYLKPAYRLNHQPQLFQQKLRKSLGYLDEDNKEDNTDIVKDRQRAIDPALIAAQYVVWPLYPVVVQPPGNDPTVTIDGRFRHNDLIPIDKKKLFQKAQEWGFSENVAEPKWGFWDWRDNKTRSRIRLWFPLDDQHVDESTLPIDPVAGKELCRQDELAALVDPQIAKKNRTCVTVKGMLVSNTEVCDPHLMLKASVGSYVWADLCGEAAPRLTADRQKAIEPEDAAQWHRTLKDVFERMAKALADVVTPDAARNLLSGFLWHSELSKIAFPEKVRPTPTPLFSWNVCTPSWKNVSDDDSFSSGLVWAQFRLFQRLQSARTFKFDDIHNLSLGGGHDIAFSRDRIRDLARPFSRELDLERVEGTDLDRTLELTREFARGYASFHQCINTAILQEAFYPDLEQSFPLLGLWEMRGKIGNGVLRGPGLVELQTGEDNRTLQLPDLEKQNSQKIVSLGYDLVFPLTAIPLGDLRLNCPRWREEVRYRRIGVVPFLLPDFDKTWKGDADKLKLLFGVDHIYALLPNEKLWTKAFDDWTTQDSRGCCLSALWSISSGQVLWSRGVVPLKEMSLRGQTLRNFLKNNDEN